MRLSIGNPNSSPFCRCRGTATSRPISDAFSPATAAPQTNNISHAAEQRPHLVWADVFMIQALSKKWSRNRIKLGSADVLAQSHRAGYPDAHTRGAELGILRREQLTGKFAVVIAGHLMAQDDQADV